MSDQINHPRRRFLGSAAMTLAAAQFALNGAFAAQPAKPKSASLRTVKPGTNIFPCAWCLHLLS